MAAPTMTRAPPPPPPTPPLPRSSDTDLSFVASSSSSAPPSPPPPPPPPLSGDPPRNPWRITHSGDGGGGATGSVTLMGEPSSSWPPLSSSQQQQRSVSPPHPAPPEIHPATTNAETENPTTTDPPSPPSSSSSSSSSSPSPELASHEETPPPTIATASSSPAPPALAIIPPPSAVNAATAANPSRPLRSPGPSQRRGRNQRFNNQRGGGGPRSNNSYSNRPQASDWRPNWSGFNSGSQYQHWGFNSVVPPADLNPYFLPYPPPYNELVYPDYGSTELYENYYSQPPFEIPYTLPMSPGVAGVPPPQLHPSFPGVPTSDHKIRALKDQLISQIEYYFSDGNLVKDPYLRCQMDGQGWVDIHKIASFKRAANLTKDISLIMDTLQSSDDAELRVSIIKDALQSSNAVELHGNKMRKRHEWDKWILQQPPQTSLATSMQNIKLDD